MANILKKDSKYDVYYGRWDDYYKDWENIDEDLLGRYKNSKVETDHIIDSDEEIFRFFDDIREDESSLLYFSEKNIPNFYINESYGEGGGPTVDPDEPIEVRSIRLNKSTFHVTAGDEIEIDATVFPANATDKTLKWYCEPENFDDAFYLNIPPGMPLNAEYYIPQQEQLNSSYYVCDTNKLYLGCRGYNLDDATLPYKITCKSNNDKTASCLIYTNPTPLESFTVSLTEYYPDSDSVYIYDENTIYLFIEPGNYIPHVRLVVEMVPRGNVVWKLKEDPTNQDQSIFLGITDIIHNNEYDVYYNEYDPKTTHADTSMYVIARYPGTAEVIVQSAYRKRLPDGGYLGFSLVPFSGKDLIQKSFTIRAIILPEEIRNVPDDLSLNIGDTYQLNSTVYPENATYESLIYSTDDNSVVTVSNTGLITAVGEGTTTIHIGIVVDSLLKDESFKSIDVTVTELIIEPTNLSVGKMINNDMSTAKEVILGITAECNDNFVLIPSVLPENTTNKDVTWEILSGEPIINMTDYLDTECKHVELLGPGSGEIKVSCDANSDINKTIPIIVNNTPDANGYLKFTYDSFIPCASYNIDPPTCSWDVVTNTLTMTFTRTSQKVINNIVMDCKYYVTFDSIEYLNANNEHVSLDDVVAKQYIGFYEGSTSLGGTGKYSIKPYTVYIAAEVVEPYNNEKVLQFNTSSKYISSNGAITPITIKIHNIRWHVYTGESPFGANIENEVNSPITPDPSVDPSTGDIETDPSAILGSIDYLQDNNIEINGNLPSGQYALMYCDSDDNILDDWHMLYTIEK